jgi:hypothetical protein
MCIRDRFEIFDDFSIPDLFDQIFGVLSGAWGRGVALFSRRELLEWLEAMETSF